MNPPATTGPTPGPDAPVAEAGGADSRAQRQRERYGMLLVAILAAFALQGIANPGPWEQVIVSALLGATLLLALWAAESKPRVMRPALVVAVLVVIFSIVEATNGKVDGAAPRLANLLLILLAPGAIVVGVVRSLRARGSVTLQAVFGVLCLYLLRGHGVCPRLRSNRHDHRLVLRQRGHRHRGAMPVFQLHDADDRRLRGPHGQDEPGPHAVGHRGTARADLSGHDRVRDRQQPAPAPPGAMPEHDRRDAPSGGVPGERPGCPRPNGSTRRYTPRSPAPTRRASTGRCGGFRTQPTTRASPSLPARCLLLARGRVAGERPCPDWPRWRPQPRSSTSS